MSCSPICAPASPAFTGSPPGPMAPVVKELAALPDDDIRAMAVYLGSFNGKPIGKAEQEALAAKLESSTGTQAVPIITWRAPL